MTPKYLSMMLPTRVVERLIAYRRHLRFWQTEGRPRIYSHELAALEGITSAVVRRDLMTIGYAGSPARGYDVAGLIECIGQRLDGLEKEGVLLVGVGSLGRAILRFLDGVHPELPILAAFDIAQEKIGRILHGCRTYHINDMDTVVADRRATVGIVAVPASAAQDVTDRLLHAGVCGIMNFTPVRLRVPPDVHVENMDIAVSLEKVAFFARAQGAKRATHA